MDWQKLFPDGEVAIGRELTKIHEEIKQGKVVDVIDYYTKRSNSATEQLDALLKQNPYNKHAYKLLCQIYRDKHQENLLNSTIRKYGKTAGFED